jgi:hypothetical protein
MLTLFLLTIDTIPQSILLFAGLVIAICVVIYIQLVRYVFKINHIHRDLSEMVRLLKKIAGDAEKDQHEPE